MALAEFAHHSSRGLRTARAWEVEEHEAYDGLRAQKAPPPGVRPGSLAEPAPHRSDRCLRRSSEETPLLGVPCLADATAEAIDGRTLRFLLQKNLAQQKEEEEKERRKVVAKAKEDKEQKAKERVEAQMSYEKVCDFLVRAEIHRFPPGSSSSSGAARKREEKEEEKEEAKVEEEAMYKVPVRIGGLPGLPALPSRWPFSCPFTPCQWLSVVFCPYLLRDARRALCCNPSCS